MPDEIIHHMRPGPIREPFTLCASVQKGEYIAELSPRGMRKVNCPDCLFIQDELLKLWTGKDGANLRAALERVNA